MRSGFTSKSRGRRVPHPGLDCMCDVGSGGFRRRCLKVVRHLKNCKFTKLADAHERTRNIWPAEVDEQVVDRNARREPNTHGSTVRGLGRLAHYMTTPAVWACM